MHRSLLYWLIFFQLLLGRASGQNSFRAKYREWIEDNERVEVRSWYAESEHELSTDWSVEVLGTIDAWSGATPTGLPPENASPTNPDEWLSYVDEEIRNAGQFILSKKTPEYDVDWEYGISDEPDYLSRSYAIRYARKLAGQTLTLHGGLSYHDDQVMDTWSGMEKSKTNSIAVIGLHRIVNPNTSITVNLSYYRPKGYLNDPYKIVAAQETIFFSDDTSASTINYFPENRPNRRNIFVFYTEAFHYNDEVNAGVIGQYRFFRDNYDLSGHTLELEWNKKIEDEWVISPRGRFYRQDQSNFYNSKLRNYQPYFDSPNPASGPYYSSDYRLSSFDSLSLGIKIVRLMREDLKLDFSYDRYKTNGRDSITSDLVYPQANVFSLGFQWDY